MNNKNQMSIIPMEFTHRMIALFSSGMADLVNAEWAIATECLGHHLVPFGSFGRNPNVQACLAEMRSALSGQVAHTNLSETDVVFRDAHSEDWTPRVLCAIRVHGELVSILALGPRKTANPYTDGDQAFISRHVRNFSFQLSDEGMTGRAGTQITRARGTGSELETAREVQQRLLPRKLPRITGLEYCGESQACDELGGDFFNFIPTGESSLFVSIGSVGGKGTPSAIMMAALQGSLRPLASCLDCDIRRLVHTSNRMVWELAPDNLFVTMFCARIDVARREIRYVNAGHDRAILLRAGHQHVVRLESTGAVLGLSPSSIFNVRVLRFEPGDTLVAVTDGIVEACLSNSRSLDRTLLDAARECVFSSARDLAERIIEMTQRQNEDAGRVPDDKTVVVVRRVRDSAESIVRIPITTRNLAHAAGL
jgi:sigma-B regulation protein RsbU (phosphoserine phosphatase)